jgi:hypothetical protein
MTGMPVAGLGTKRKSGARSSIWREATNHRYAGSGSVDRVLAMLKGHVPKLLATNQN